nr:MAG TPA: Mycobacterial 2 TMS Phage Holin (M2 Hol) Family [Caudoviricetes sp.]DAP11148.1 MAG TPA: Mycobacterial 2 TMS Phage Holin (M2 Hol) Family [Caudoviricetes sp.]
MIITNPDVRRWIYGIATAALAVLGVYGIVTGEQITAWSGLASAITGLATVNTPAGEKQEG